MAHNWDLGKPRFLNNQSVKLRPTPTVMLREVIEYEVVEAWLMSIVLCDATLRTVVRKYNRSLTESIDLVQFKVFICS